ncbi:MAG: NAD-dependent epimerase/dehydratase family protein [Chloroflexi bacterium]|nr:NAD-dependent epimerase/dehydratase family protein [Chloroflexota bacterium]
MIIVAGASGFVGRALLAELAAHDATRTPVRALVRREFEAVRLRDQGVEAVAADLLTRRGVDTAMRGTRTLVYLVHTLARPGDVVANDLDAVQNALLAARAAGVQRVVFLGCVGASDTAASTYLVARWATELAIRQAGLRTVLLRAPLIIGRGGTLFEMMRRLVDRSPVVPLFAWRHVPVEPVALSDVAEALRIAATDHELDGRSFDICGAERLTVSAVVRGWGRAHGRRRLYVPLPTFGEPIGEHVASTLARLPRRETRLLLETLREPQVCRDPSRRFPLPHRPLTYAQALAALDASARSTG